jgi:Dynamin family
MLARADNEANNQDRFKEQMRAYDRWKVDIAHAVNEYKQWLEDHRMGTPEVELRLHETLEGLRSDRLVIAFVAEFSRGKTELINAIFFSDYQRRLLPSEAGRTTMCPTELFYDQQNDEAYIRLLPIETRMEDLSITELKNNPERWTTIPLDINSPDQMAEALREVVKVKRVNLEAAKLLGLHGDELHNHNKDDDAAPTHVDIPMWRHALISFPHPLLQQGLVILDTPGLNALGSEPELTLSMLPNAHAVLFVLAADTGVTRSDMDMWQFHIKTYRKNGHKGLVAALNKIDTLWDEMKTPEDVEKSVLNQCAETAKLLGIELGSVFPVSAQKALVGKIRKDQDLLARSRILELEDYLADKILPAKQVIVRDTVVGIIDQLLNATRQMVAQRFNSAHKQLDDLRSLSGRNSDVITNLMRKTRERQATYNKNMESFQASRRILTQHSKSMLDALSIKAVDDLVTKTRQDMEGSWTTAGMKKGMKTFFDGARDAMHHVATQAEQTHNAVQAIYRKFNEELGLSVGESKTFSLQKFRMELERLYEEAETFRNSPITTMTEQHFVVKKFFISLGSHVRHLFAKANKEADAWFKGILIPLVKQVSENKQLLDQHLETLCKINESRDSLDTKIRELEKRCALLEREEETLRNIHERLHIPIPAEASTSAEGTATLSRAAS